MGILDSVERGLERAVNAAFARTFRSGVQPVEIAAGLKRELDIGSVVVDRDRVLAPNRFVVRVSSADADRLTRMGGTLERELIGVVTKHAKRQGYQLLGEADVELRRDDSLTTGVMQIDAAQVDLIEAERDYMRLHVGGRSWLIHQTIKSLEARMDPDQFMRIHRSKMIRRGGIVGLKHHGDGAWSVDLGEGGIHRIGRTYLHDVKAIMHA